MDFVHEPLDTQVEAIGGHYRFVAEKRLDFDGRSVLYRIGYVLLDSSCCGPAGCAYALVAGFVRGWKVRRTKAGHDVSEVDAIVDKASRVALRRRLLAEEAVTQVVFQ